jgi:tRNA A-37 threonylcarbamoyl transferase component Bud32
VIQRENDGVRWELQPDFAPLLGELLQSPGGTVKQSSVKLVTRHQLGAKTFYVKRYFHHAVPLRPLKFFFKSTQARQEWDLARQLEARHIPIVRHVALGERRTWKGVQESILVTEGFDGIEVDRAKDIDPQAVLKFVEAMHARGVLQEDLHLANLLVKIAPFELRLVDLHGTRVRELLSAEERQKNLALLRVFLPIQVSPQVEEQGRELRKNLLHKRSSRCLRNNQEFERQRHGNLKWQVRLPFVNRAVTRTLAAPDEFLASRAKILKPGNTSTVGKADGLVLKRFNFRKAGNLLKDLFRPSRARRAFRKAYHLQLTGIPTARSIATADRRICGFLVRSYLLMEEIHGAMDLTTFFRGGGQAHPKLVRAAAQLLARLHNEGFSHRDLKESNLILDDEGQLYLIDLDGMTFLQHVSDDRAALDLARLVRGVENYPGVTRQDRIQFYRTYLRSRGLRRLLRNIQTGD